ncbi:hypothetical protein Sgleb_09150 [Streptomyces glebosus]|uniref:Uncharacterized protein n=1 Tax=Streptomyces glebosus TaxID=249580 RepID=A0A640SP67_9ACTN|nr:hypothetical protein Sgleb_09150 [Streptomyces glebosus]
MLVPYVVPAGSAPAGTVAASTAAAATATVPTHRFPFMCPASPRYSAVRALAQRPIDRLVTRSIGEQRTGVEGHGAHGVVGG